MPRQKKQRLKRRKDGRYVCRYKDQWFFGYTEDEALAAREAYKALERSGEVNLLAGPRLKDYAEKWLASLKPDASEKTRRLDRGHIKKLTDRLGDQFLADIRPSDIKAVYSSCYVGLSDEYIKKAAQLYRKLFDAAQEDGYIRKNPARQSSAKPHRGTVGGHRAITDQERQWIETFCTDHRAYPAIMAMLYAGLRPPEAKALNIDKAVDFAAGEIHLSEFANLKGSNSYTVTGKGKTSKSVRTIPLFQPLRLALIGRHGLLIRSAAGKPITPSSWRSLYRSYVQCMETAINGCRKRWYGRTREHMAIIAAGGSLPPWVAFTVVPYDLRHSFCTWCRDNGVELKTCARWMGHADAKMILQIYDEAPDSRSKSEAERLEKKLFGSQDGSQEDQPTPSGLDK